MNSIEKDKEIADCEQKNKSNLAEDRKKHSYYYDDSTNYSIYRPEEECDEEDS